jgi:hypothetical protein
MECGQKQYRVTVHRAHQGRGRAAALTFYIAARDAIHASNIARRMPGVKHSRSVISCIAISADEYTQGRTRSAYHMG